MPEGGREEQCQAKATSAAVVTAAPSTYSGGTSEISTPPGAVECRESVSVSHDDAGVGAGGAGGARCGLLPQHLSKVNVASQQAEIPRVPCSRAQHASAEKPSTQHEGSPTSSPAAASHGTAKRPRRAARAPASQAVAALSRKSRRPAAAPRDGSARRTGDS
eukprot:CAMPEP_0179113128 /NCGR_PEP_ID=MMETSP0796-20121207/52914_1 /TAXON_ID=73915 /ORGANISM="Pyrodinium bahamense, Strain pbaha01" /LENGTH=161 /DNA_ID=CAMNT_0020811317 /DNA_START=251 /DNA_END=733 /DNA_ORIENTATION=+